ncbi:hypothetical protein SAMN05443429_105164 [Cruoricaptor ignavus]|uniref:DUF2268 domain-containing protein n=1 Tax=Cruoricaptor ignavus TaxID=1118202 RepID=A0A1M6EMT6_9FLAO|nr:hypothetical protein [Cruoricaptor ignavus]SHI86865.1 hypothetical protein SAMN05443429_105164 [Cruoricaptor ignavus]
MTKTFKIIFLSIIIGFTIQTRAQNVFSSDVDNFWKAYDKITKTKDSILQKKLLEDLYFSKGTEGLKAIRKARNYTSQDYINAINNYPKFWNSVRKNTLKSKRYQRDLNLGIEKLRKIYPELKPAKIYFTIGALRTNGTYSHNLVLIGSEIAMTDKKTITDEFPESIRNARRKFFDSEPIKDLVLLNIHEYVHTQQKPFVDNILSFVITEGVAEFISTKAMNLPSASPAINYGKTNSDKVRNKFEEEMFNMNNLYKWLWGDSPNDFGVRDLGYYIGYQMCENFYNQAEDKNEAIKKMIELDYSNEDEVEDFVKKSNFFSKSLDDLYNDYENKRPTVIGIKQFKNKSNNVDPKINEITVEFSEPLNGYNTGIDFGDLGQNAFPKNDVKKRYWSKDKKFWTISVTLEPKKKYQLLITNNFRTDKNIPLKQYLIEFETRE